MMTKQHMRIIGISTAAIGQNIYFTDMGREEDTLAPAQLANRVSAMQSGTTC